MGDKVPHTDFVQTPVNNELECIVEYTETSFAEDSLGSSYLLDENILESPIEKKQEEVRKLKQELLLQEIEVLETTSRANSFTSFNGWGSAVHVLFDPTEHASNAQRLHALMTQDLVDSRMGGYFLQWDGKGIAINPGKQFLERFFTKGHHIREIDYVIVTAKESTAWADLETISTMNKEINALLEEYEKEPHFISYFLHPMVFATAVRLFRPSCREEANAVKSLESFSALEHISLHSSIDLFYTASLKKDSLLLRFELAMYEQEKIVFGYLSQVPWKECYAEFFATCQYLILGLGGGGGGKSNFQDREKLAQPKHTLGYFGAYSALQALDSVRVAFLSEYGAGFGDIRLEFVKKMRSELEAVGKNCALFPIEQDVELDLASFSVRLHGEIVPVEAVRVVRLQEPFCPLVFVSCDNVC